jgi:hypothetical protein
LSNPRAFRCEAKTSDGALAHVRPKCATRDIGKTLNRTGPAKPGKIGARACNFAGWPGSKFASQNILG